MVRPDRLQIISIILVIALLVSCRKKIEMPPNNNEIRATIIFSSGKQIQIYGKNTKARMGWDWIGMTYLEVSDDLNGLVSFTAFPAIKSPGTYNNFSVQFRPATVQRLPDYDNFQLSNTGSLANRGSVTFSRINDHNMEGAFHAVCWARTDTVIITGTFKGDYLN